MLEHLPIWIGALCRTIRAGHAQLAIVENGVAPGELLLDLASPAFANGGRIPARFTADGEGLSPPLIWRGVPEDTASLALLVEDADAPFPKPLVHALVWDMPADRRELAEAAIGRRGAPQAAVTGVGRNSYFREDWLPPDPPPGHGSHDYVFQLFALARVPDLDAHPGRSAFVEAIRGNVLAAGMLVGTYSRDEGAPAGPAAALAT